MRELVGLRAAVARALGGYTSEDLSAATTQAVEQVRASIETRHEQQLAVLAEQLEEARAFAYPALSQILSERSAFGGRGVEPLDQNFSAYLKASGAFPWVSSCVDVIATAGASVPLCLYDESGDKIEKHPILDRIERPNPNEGYFAFWYGALTSLGYTGEVFLSAVGDARVPWIDPEELWCLQADRIGPVYNRNNVSRGNAEPELIGWDYSAGYGTAAAFRFPSDAVIMAKMTNPRDPIRGLSPLKRLEPTLNLLWSAMAWNKTFFESGAALSLLITTKTASQPAIDAFRKMVRQDLVGPKARTWVFQGDDVNAKDFSSTPKDAEFMGLMQKCREEILATYHVTPLVLGLLDQPAEATAAEQQKVFWRQSVMPWNKLLTDALNNSVWIRYQDERLYLEHDYSGIEALQTDKESEARTVSALTGARIITRNEAREMLGREALDGLDEFDERFDPFAGLGLGEPGSKDGGDPGDETDEEPDDEKPGKDFGAYSSRVRALRLKRRAEAMSKGQARRDVRWAAHEERVLPIERGWARTVMRSFRSMLASVLDDIDRRANIGLSAQESLARFAADDKVPPHWETDPPTISPSEIVKAQDNFRPMSQSTVRAGYEDIFEELDDIRVPFDADRPEVKNFVEHRLTRHVRTIVSTQQDRVAALVSDAAREGKTIGQLVTDLRKSFGELGRSFAERIARTETCALYSHGHQVAMEDAGIETKEWISARDAFVRPTHEDADGQIVGIKEYFVLSDGDSGPYPGQMGRVENVANCRCTHVMGGK